MSEELSGNEYRQQRIENMNKLEEAGFPAFGKAFERTDSLEQLHADFEVDNVVKACGRIVAIRKMGKMAFAHISDGTYKFQLMVKKDLIGDDNFDAFKLLMQTEGIIPALESSHALAGGFKRAKEMRPDQHIVINLSGRGDKDIFNIARAFPQPEWGEFLQREADRSKAIFNETVGI